MKLFKSKLTLLLSLGTGLALCLSACMFNEAAPVPDAVSPVEQVVKGDDPYASGNTSEPPTPVAINLAGPDVGTMMPWVDGSTLVFVPGGEFIMGAGGEDNPETIITLSDFWIYRTEVSNRMYALCIAAGYCTPPADLQASQALGDVINADHPVTGVTWEQGSAYCNWVRGDLPTEAQWEKTARGPEGNIYPWGNAAPNCDLSNFDGCIGRTSGVFEHPAGKSFYDALDMSGNALEWVFDWYDPRYYGSQIEDPTGPNSGGNRSVRGSGYATSSNQLETARRLFLDPAMSRLDLGFRCVIGDPVVYPPYCEASAYSESGDPEGTEPLPETPSLQAKVAGQGCGFVTADISGGTVQSVSSNHLNCTLAGNNRIYCSGDSSATDDVTVCTESGNAPGTTASLPKLNCGVGFVLDGDQCQYAGPNISPPSMCKDGFCSIPGDSGQDCPAGSFFDKQVGDCIGYGPGEDICLSGFEYDAELGCCRAEKNNYPGCGPGEFRNSDGGCESFSPSSGDNACMTFSVTTGGCASGDSGDGPAACVPSANNCFCDTPCP
jgi:formylglycine-generating enzyme required for sulfatase activity